MAKLIQGTEVIMRAKKDYSFRTSLPRTKDAELIFHFKKSKETPEDGYFYCTLPVQIKFKDDYGKEKIFHENYAQFVYDTYEGIEVVEVTEKPIIDAPVINTTKKKKEKKNEKISA